MASIVLGFALILLAGTGVFYIAPVQAVHGIPWAVDACATVPDFCRHPEWMGLAGAAMAVAYISLKGVGTT